MKQRHGFVSNSSSTSFIVSFPYDIKTEQKLGRLLFDRTIPTDEISFENTIVKFLFEGKEKPVIFKTKDEVIAYLKKKSDEGYEIRFNKQWYKDRLDKFEKKYSPNHYFIYEWRFNDCGPMVEKHLHNESGSLFYDYIGLEISNH